MRVGWHRRPRRSFPATGPHRSRWLHSLLVALATVPVWPVAPAQDLPLPPCGGAAPRPAYSQPGTAPAALIWSDGTKWVPPHCVGWSQESSEIGIALAGSFPFTGTTDDLLARFGAVSMLRGVRYWSVSDATWRVLIENAVALAGPDGKLTRADFAAAEMRNGAVLYFSQRDNRTSHDVLYRMRVQAPTQDHLSVEIENASAVRLYLLPLYRPGALQSWFFIDRLTPDLWGVYALSRTVDTPSWLPGDARRSSANRALALYRHFIGEQTDREPPLAP
jgi:uncharacterized protein DUF6675